MSKINDINIIGIPVILYMSIMSNIDITENATRPELYNRIFAEEGGIFDRFSYEGDGYDEGSHPLRNKENIIIYLHFLRSLAFKMFEKNSLTLRRECFQVPNLSFQRGYISVLEFPIKHLFENVESGIEFIHKSIYEYFAADYIVEVFHENINKTKEEFAGILGHLFKENKLSKEIIEFIRYKIRIDSYVHNSFCMIYEAFQLMLQNGMTYYTDVHYKKVIDYEMNLFANMLEVLHLWDNIKLELNDAMCEYIKYNRNKCLNLRSSSAKEDNTTDLKGVYLEKVKLNGSNLQGVDLSGSNLRGADFSGANLRGADLSGANLQGAYFTNVDLSGANLRRADLSGANFKKSLLVGVNFENAELAKAELCEVDLRETDLRKVDVINANLSGGILDETQILYLKENKYNLLGLDVYMKESKETISYEKYCIRNAKNGVQNLLKKK